jgi:hypothetical protein
MAAVEAIVIDILVIPGKTRDYKLAITIPAFSHNTFL